jgi:uncharacterized LabA/DUF88 family protein
MTTAPSKRVSFFVDGFNLYHSIRAAEKLLPGSQLKWLNLQALCQSFLPLLGREARLAEIHYFSAYADHLRTTNREKVSRHEAFVRALTATGVKVHLSKFSKKQVWSHDTDNWVNAYEEKETDVAIACAVLGDALEDKLDIAVVISGDSDFIPLAQTFAERAPNKDLRFALPFARGTKRLRQLCPDSFSISKESYQRHQFPDRVRLPSGKFVTIPEVWKEDPSQI